MVSTQTFSVEGILHFVLEIPEFNSECLCVSAPFVSLLTVHIE